MFAGARGCRFCGTVFHGPSEERPDLELKEFLSTLLSEHDMPDALARMAKHMLGADLEAPQIARGVAALAAEYHGRENVTLDATALSRLFWAYCKARTELEREEESEINLPLFASHATGFKHFQMRLRWDDLARLEA